MLASPETSAQAAELKAESAPSLERFTAGQKPGPFKGTPLVDVCRNIPVEF
jgi:hypothetical protein